MGLAPAALPLSAVEPRSWAVADPHRHDALLLGSANAVRHAGPDLQALIHLPVYAVGAATAKAAQQAGFTIAAIGDGNLQSLAPLLARDGRAHALRLTGEEHLPFAPLGDCRVETHICYAVVDRPLLAAQVPANAVILLHSLAMARHFEAERARLALPVAACSAVAISLRVAEALQPGWRDVHVAAQPFDQAMLAQAALLCAGA